MPAIVVKVIDGKHVIVSRKGKENCFEKPLNAAQKSSFKAFLKTIIPEEGTETDSETEK